MEGDKEEFDTTGEYVAAQVLGQYSGVVDIRGACGKADIPVVALKAGSGSPWCTEA